MEQNEYYCIDKALENCKSIDIDVKMRYSADVQHLKLQHELKISTFLKDHEAHDNYKDIRKDVQKINEMVEEALALSIELDASVTQSVNDFTSKIISERNLRKQRDLYLEDISNSNQEKVEKL
jgi:ferritin